MIKPIQLPVQYDEKASQLVDAEGCAWLDVDALDYDDRETCVAMVNQIAAALNTAADQSRVIEVMATMLDYIAEDHTDSWDNGWGYAESKRDMAIEALAEAARIMEGK